jgi:AcrR family transcriptional regulator
VLPFFLEETDSEGRRRLLVAALKCFARAGLHGTSVRDIADQAGLTNPALYKHFESKDALALYLFERCYSRLYDRIALGLREARSNEDALHRFVLAFVELMDDQPDALMFVHENTAELFPRASARTRSRRLVQQAESLAARHGLEGDALAIAGASMIGSLSHVGRLIALGALARPASRWTRPLLDTLGRIVDARDLRGTPIAGP